MSVDHYTEKRLCDLQADELVDLQQKLSAGLVICPVCCRFVDSIYSLPQRYWRHVGLLYFSPPPPKTSCRQCIADMADRRRKARWEAYKIENGIITVLDSQKRDHDKKGNTGFVYVSSVNGITKIGATSGNTAGAIVARLRDFSNSDGVAGFVRAIETHLPFALERFIDDRYASKIVKNRELFSLSLNDLVWLSRIKSVNGVAVVQHESLTDLCP